MSHIDSCDHELVGYFAGYPVYHVLDTDVDYTPDSDNEDFWVGYHQLVIGGGSGELPGLVMVNPDLAVKAYVLGINEEESRPDERKFSIDKSLQEALEEELRDADSLNKLVFAGWNTVHHMDFFERCQSKVLRNPYDYADGYYDVTFEEWLLQGFGEFVYLAMPDLAPETVALFKPFEPEYLDNSLSNILLPIPNATIDANHGLAFSAKRRNMRKLKANH